MTWAERGLAVVTAFVPHQSPVFWQWHQIVHLAASERARWSEMMRSLQQGQYV